MSERTIPQAIVLCGVSGSGKSTVGKMAAGQLGWRFADADDFHPAANVEKMRQGIPLTTADRLPWLEDLKQWISDGLAAGESGILACSALTHSYREILAQAGSGVRFAFLQGDFDLIYNRLQERPGHYMPASLLRSQFESLEPPDHALVLDIRQPPAVLAAQLAKWALG